MFGLIIKKSNIIKINRNLCIFNLFNFYKMKENMLNEFKETHINSLLTLKIISKGKKLEHMKKG